MLLASKSSKWCHCHFLETFKRPKPRNSERELYFFPPVKFVSMVINLMEKSYLLIGIHMSVRMEIRVHISHTTHILIYVLKIISYSFIATDHFIVK